MKTSPPRWMAVVAGLISRRRRQVEKTLAKAVLAWARGPRAHGGNPYMLDFVKMAGEIVFSEICACYKDCRQDSHTGDWHTHEGEPCATHPEATMVG